MPPLNWYKQVLQPGQSVGNKQQETVRTNTACVSHQPSSPGLLYVLVQFWSVFQVQGLHGYCFSSVAGWTPESSNNGILGEHVRLRCKQQRPSCVEMSEVDRIDLRQNKCTTLPSPNWVCQCPGLRDPSLDLVRRRWTVWFREGPGLQLRAGENSRFFLSTISQLLLSMCYLLPGPSTGSNRALVAMFQNFPIYRTILTLIIDSNLFVFLFWEFHLFCLRSE